MAALESKACQKSATEVSDVLHIVDRQWRALEERLEEAVSCTIHDHTEDLTKWFGADVSDSFSDWTDGGLRHKTRDRVQKLLLAPLDEHIRHKIPLSGLQPSACLASTDSSKPIVPEEIAHPIDMLLEHWERTVEPMLSNAEKEDMRHAKKQRRLEAVGALRDVKQLEEKRLHIWASVRSVVAVAEKPARDLAALLSTELSSERIAQMVAAVPSIVARSTCDWHFQRCTREFDQLNAWWENARAALCAQQKLWDKLMEDEGVFVRRVDRGIAEIAAQKSRYAALANFGHSSSKAGCAFNGWPAESAALLARTVNEMHRRLRPIRDSAAWRIIDSAKAIRKAIAEEEKASEGSPWQQVGHEEGMTRICQCLGIENFSYGDLKAEPQGVAALHHLSPADSALCFAGMLDGLAGIVTDLGKLIDDDIIPDTGGVSYILEEVLQEISYVQEDLLVVMDDASEASLSHWLHTCWRQWGEGAGTHLEAAMCAMPLKADSLLGIEKRQARRSQLALMRGLHCLLADGCFRSRILDLAASSGNSAPDGEIVSCAQPLVCTPSHSADEAGMLKVEAIPLCDDAFACAYQPASPRSGYVSRKPEKLSCRKDESAPRAELQGPSAVAEVPQSQAKSDVRTENLPVDPTLNHPETPLHSKRLSTPSGPLKASEGTSDLQRDSPNVPHCADSALRQAITQLSQAQGPTVSMTPARPVTPSWLEPPWPRHEVPFQSWSRPGTAGTASTVCDEADLMHMPKWKHVDGQRIPLRSACAGTRLPPINLS